MADRALRISKFLARHLRHEPQAIGLTLRPGGWVTVEELLRACAEHGFPITCDELDAAVEAPGKRRYAYDDTGGRVRAMQGHSVAVELGYTAEEPPAVLYHGTHARVVDQVCAEGLKPMRRRHVHLSGDVRTARLVGARRGKPVILAVDAAALHGAGQVFHRAENGVWLTGPVAASALRRLDDV